MPFVLRPTLAETYLERVRTTPELKGWEFKPSDPEAGPVGRWKSVSFREFDRECRLVSAGLSSLGLNRGARAAILASTCYEWTLADFAILGAGAVTVPIHPSSTAEDCAYILNDTDARIVICEDGPQLQKLLSVREQLPEVTHIVAIQASALRLAGGRKDVLSFRALAELGRREEARHPGRFEQNLRAAAPEDALTLCPTSGTSGHPKCATLTHANAMSVLEDIQRTMGSWLEADRETLLSFLPFSHVMGKVESLLPWACGWKLCLAESPDQLLMNLAETRPTLLFAVPRVFERAVADLERRLSARRPTVRKLFARSLEASLRVVRARDARSAPSPRDLLAHGIAAESLYRQVRARFGGRLKAVISGGAPLAVPLQELFTALGIPVLEGYGLTETCGPISVNLPGASRLGSVGRPLPEVAVRIAEDGEILISSRKVFAGYWGDEAATREALAGGWLRTGDIGHLDREGYLFITDRKKDVIVTPTGKKISPQKIEKLLEAQPLIARASVHGEQRPYLTALLTLEPESAIAWARQGEVLFSDLANLARNPKLQQRIQSTLDRLNAELPPHERIRRFSILPREFTPEGGELTGSQKIRRKSVNQKYKAVIESLYDPLTSEPDLGTPPIEV